MSTEVWGRRRLRQVVVSSVAAVAAGLFVWALPGAIRFLAEAPTGFWAMALAALVVDIPLFGVSGREDLRVRSTLTVCFTFAIFVLWGAGPAILVQAVAGTISGIGQRYPPSWQLYLVSRLVCALAAAQLVVSVIELPPVSRQGVGLDGRNLLTFIVLATVWVLVSYGLLALARVTMSPGGWRQAFGEVRTDLFSTAAAILVVAPLLTAISDGWALLVALPLLVWNVLSREQLLAQRRRGREPMSGLLNQQGLVEGVRAITAADLTTPQGPRPFGIILVNFESVMAINRTLGRDIYEKVVAVASRRLIDAYGANQAARLSGEGVVILVPDLADRNAIAEAEKAVRVLQPMVEVDDIPFALDPAAGVSLSPRHGRDLGTLLMKAELAVGEARRSGKQSVLYVRRAAELAQRRVTLLRELHTALRDPARRQEVGVLYQPQIELSSGRLMGVEALLRWTHPRWGPIPTDELIEAIEPSEVMHLLTRHVLETVAAQVRRWNDRGEQMRVSVNVSVQDLHEPDFVAELGELVRRHGIEPRYLVIEITERMLITDMSRVAQVARSLSEQGIGLSLDDFGTGYASLQQLRELPLTEVKVDRSYIRGIVDNPADAAIVTSVHELAQALEVDVVAEGVEDERTAEILAGLAGTIGQGWHFGRPMTADDLVRWRAESGYDGGRS